MKQNKSPIQYFNMALKYYENNIYDKAIYYFKKSIIAKPIDEFDFCDNIDTYIMIGMSFMSINDNSKENLENIVYYYTLALKNIHKTNYIPKNKSSFKIIYDDLGIAYHMLYDIPNAVKYYEKSVNFDDNVSVTTYKNLIYIYRHITNEIDKALHTALRFVHLDNQNETPYIELASIYNDLNVLDSSIKVLENSTSKIENPYKSYCNLSDIYLTKKEFEKAKKFAQKALDIKPNDFISLSNLAEAYLGLGDKILAKEYFEKTLQLDPEFEPAMIGLGRI